MNEPKPVGAIEVVIGKLGNLLNASYTELRSSVETNKEYTPEPGHICFESCGPDMKHFKNWATTEEWGVAERVSGWFQIQIAEIIKELESLAPSVLGGQPVNDRYPVIQLIKDLATIPLDALADENAPISARMGLFSVLRHMQERASDVVAAVPSVPTQSAVRGAAEEMEELLVPLTDYDKAPTISTIAAIITKACGHIQCVGNCREGE